MVRRISKKLTHLLKRIVPLMVIFGLNLKTQANESTEISRDAITDDWSIQLDGQYASDTFFQELPGANPQRNLSESFVNLSTAYQERIRLSIMANIGHLIDSNELSFNDDFDVEKFIREAYIEIRNINGMPVAIIIGKQPITFGQNIQEMPGWANSPLRSLQELDEVYGLTIKLTKSVLGLFDQIEYSLYEQESGDLSLGKLNGHNLRLTKYLNEKLLLTIGLQQKEVKNQEQSRSARVGLVGTNKSGKLIGWAEGMIFSNDPNYPNSNFALTLGASYQYVQNNRVVLEFNLIERELIQLGLGLKTQVNQSLSAGVDLRYGINLTSGEPEYFLGFNITYRFNIGTNNNINDELLLFEDEQNQVQIEDEDTQVIEFE